MVLNRIIKYLTISDLALLSGFSFISPIFPLFVVDKIQGGNMEVVGFAIGINVLVRAILQLPIARYLDKKRGDLDEYYFTIISTVMLAVTPLLYLVISTPAELYLVQIIYAVGFAMNYPAWMSLFTRHAEREREGSQWAVWSAVTGIGAAAAAAVGGIIGERYGFSSVLWLVFIVTIFGAISLFRIYDPLKAPHEHHKIKQKQAFEIKEGEIK